MLYEPFKEIWSRRLAKSNESQDKLCFDLNRLIDDHEHPRFINFNKNNHNDSTFDDFYSIILDVEAYQNVWVDVTESLRIQCVWFNDEYRFFIYDKTQEKLFVLSRYKHRGRIQAFIDTEYGQPITLQQMTYLLISANLEKDFVHDMDFRQL